MPPLEGLKVVISRRTSRLATNHKLMLVDISKPYLHAVVVDPNLYVVLPKQGKMSNMCGHLREALCGTREAAKCWEIGCSNTSDELGFTKGKTTPCLLRRHE